VRIAILGLAAIVAGCVQLPVYEPRMLAPPELQAASQLRNGFPRRLNGPLDEDGKRQLKRFIEGELALRGTSTPAQEPR
jgi:hypothetical protein